MDRFPSTLLVLALLAGPALAQQTAPAPAAQPRTDPAVAAADGGDMADGEVRRIDKANGRITLRHGEIRSLDMPGMTMVFQVRDATLLDRLQVGDRVKFRAERSGGGFLVTAVEVVK